MFAIHAIYAVAAKIAVITLVAVRTSIAKFAVAQIIAVGAVAIRERVFHGVIILWVY